MNNPFSQPKLIYKISFTTKYKDIETFEAFFPEDILGISMYELESSTIDSQDDDLWAIEILLGKKDGLPKLVNSLKIYAKTHNLHFYSEVTSQEVEDKDWVAEYQKNLKPIVIGDFFITSSTINIPCPKGKKPIYIEASRAFGTGDHATTALCIESIAALESNKITTIFDIGTGSGILSFVAEKIWRAAKVLACDIEEVSIKLAKDNRLCNNSKVHFYKNSEQDLNIDEEWINKNRNQEFDLIVSNILAAPLISMAKTIKSISHKNTIIILSGFLDYQLSSVAEAYSKVGFEVINNMQKDKWIALTLKARFD
jgi:ribosomal protein L11 methyltransferase